MNYKDIITVAVCGFTIMTSTLRQQADPDLSDKYQLTDVMETGRAIFLAADGGPIIC